MKKSWECRSTVILEARHTKKPRVRIYISNTTCDMEERAFQVDCSMSGERKFSKESCMAAVVKITKGTE